MRTAALYFSLLTGITGLTLLLTPDLHFHQHTASCYAVFDHLEGTPALRWEDGADWELVNKAMTGGVQVIVIDPGHGGRDPGCRAHGFNEKDIALNIAKKLGEQIRKEMPEIKVVFTRDRDVFVPLHERAGLANKHEADLFISIHLNSARSASVYGTETFVMGYHKAEENLEKAKENLAVAQRENEVILLEDDYQQHYGNFDPNSEVGHILLSMVQDAYIGQSLLFASKVEQAFTGTAKRHSRGVKQAGFVVLKATTMPSVLIETGFLTNRQEALFLASTAGQDKMAGSIFEALQHYKIAISADIEMPVAKSGSQTTILRPVVEFKVQLASLPKRIDTRQNPWNKVRNLEVWDLENDFKYLAGGFKNYEECQSAWQNFRKNGFSDAFIIAIKNGERIPVQEARAMVNAE